MDKQSELMFFVLDTERDIPLAVNSLFHVYAEMDMTDGQEEQTYRNSKG